MRKAIYPGSFDPITNGHIDIISRASKLFDEVIVLLAVNPNKECRFSVDERIEMLKKATSQFDNVKVDFYPGLTIQYARNVGAVALIRGLRVVSDFEYELEDEDYNLLSNFSKSVYDVKERGQIVVPISNSEIFVKNMTTLTFKTLTSPMFTSENYAFPLNAFRDGQSLDKFFEEVCKSHNETWWNKLNK